MTDDQTTTRYEVRDAENRLIAVHCRTDSNEGEKKMWWEMPDGKKGLNGTPLPDLPLYGSHLLGDGQHDDRLGHHHDQRHEDDLVVVTEGEKTAQSLLDAGLCAVGTVTGASMAPNPSALGVLADRRVVLWPDNDDPGRRHMERVAEGLRGSAAEILVYTWDEAPDHGDAADHPMVLSDNPERVDRLLTDLEGAPRWQPPSHRATDLHAANSSKPVTFTGTELKAKTLPSQKWAVPDLIPEGVIIFAGRPKIGKSWLTLGLGVAVSSGGVALGTKPVERGEVLYLALEDNERRLKKRLSGPLGDGQNLEGLHIALRWPRLDEGGAEWIDSWLGEHPDACLVVVDTLKMIRSRSSSRRNIYDIDYESLEPLVPIAAEHGVTIVVVHHSRKADAEDPLDTISGSTGLTGGADGAIVLKRERGRADAFLHVVGRDIEEDVELALNWDPDTVGWRIVGDAEEYRLSKARTEVVGVIEETGEAMTPTEVADALGENFNAVKTRMWRMAKDGQLASQDGRYTVSNRNPCNRVTEEHAGYRVTGVTEHPPIDTEASS